MWWDWTQITLLDSVLFSLLSMFILYLIGWGFLKLISAVAKCSDPLGSFDFLQKVSFRIFFGIGFLLLIVFIFSVFDFPFWVSSLMVVGLVAAGFVLARHSLKFKMPKFNFKNHAPVIVALIVLLAVVFLSSNLIAGFFGSTNDDAAYHTLIVRLILDNPNALLTRIAEPYASFFLNYPSGTHVLSAFFVTLLGVSIQKIVIMVSVILPCLIALAFYSTIKCLFENKTLALIGLIISAFLTFGISYGPVSWGGVPILSSLYLSIVGMGLIFVFLLKKQISSLTAFLLGLLFFTASKIYPDALLILSMWFFVILIARFSPKLKNTHQWKSFKLSFNRRKVVILIAFLIPIMLSLPYFYSVFTHYNMARIISSTSLSADYRVGLVTSRVDFNWLFDIPALSDFFSSYGGLLSLAPYSLLLLLVFLIQLASQRVSSIFPSKAFTKSLLIIYSFTLLVLSYLTLTLFLSLNVFTVFLDPERVWQHLFIPGVILTAVVLFSVIYFLGLGFKRLLYTMDKTNAVKISKNKLLACALLVLLLFNVGLLSAPVISSQQATYNKIGSLFNTYETLGRDDLSLLNWVNENVPMQDHILVSEADSGQFVSAMTQRETVSLYSGLRNYTDLMELLTTNASDPSVVPLLVEYNVSYVYIGSIATTYAPQNPVYGQFNSTQFLSTSYFTLTKEFGDAWLFQFNATDGLIAYKTLAGLKT